MFPLKKEVIVNSQIYGLLRKKVTVARDILANTAVTAYSSSLTLNNSQHHTNKERESLSDIIKYLQDQADTLNGCISYLDQAIAHHSKSS